MLESSKAYDTDKGFHSLVAIPPHGAYETFTPWSVASASVEIYATAGANPNARA